MRDDETRLLGEALYSCRQVSFRRGCWFPERVLPSRIAWRFSKTAWCRSLKRADRRVCRAIGRASFHHPDNLDFSPDPLLVANCEGLAPGRALDLAGGWAQCDLPRDAGMAGHGGGS